MTQNREEKPKPTLRIMNHHSLTDSIAFIEEMTGEKLTVQEIEELRRVLDDINAHRPSGEA